LKDSIWIVITALICITIIAVVGLGMGYDGAIVAAGMATVAGIAGGATAYKASEKKYPQWHEKRVMEDYLKDLILAHEACEENIILKKKEEKNDE